MQIRDIEKLKVWLLKKLQPVCDADPAALSKYIIALLRKEKPRSALKELCINQLEVFLSKETSSFVDKLFRSLDSESYLTGSDEGEAPPIHVAAGNRMMDGGRNTGTNVKISSPLMGGSSERIVTDYRRQSEDLRQREVDDDERDFRRTHYRHDNDYYSHMSGGGNMMDRNRIIKKKIEIDPPRRSIRQRLGNREDERRRRKPRSRSRSSTPDRTSSLSPSTTPPGDTEDHSRLRKRNHSDPMGMDSDMKPPLKRQRCKDYDEKGMCLLGEQCPYDHGNDPLVITGIPPYPPPPFPIPMPPPPNIPPPLPKPPPVVTDGYNPEEPSLTNPPSLPPPPPILPHQLPMRPAFPPPIPGLPSIPPLVPPIHPNVSNTSAFTSINNKPSSTSSTIYRPPIGIKQSPRHSDTIVLRKIPHDMNTITKLSGYFERFGTIVNLQVRYEGDPESAIVQFSSPFEAKAAHDCTEAVLNNRFIRVYYLKVNTGGGIATDNKPPLDHSQVSKSHHSAGVTGQATNTSSSTHFTHSVNYTQTTARTSQAAPTTKSPVAPPIHHPPPPRQHHKSPMAVPTVIPTATNLKRLELHKKTQSLYESQLKQQKLLLNKLEKNGKTMSNEEREKVVNTIKTLSSSIVKLKETLTAAAKIKPTQQPAPSMGAQPVNKSHTSNTPPSNTTNLQQQADQLRNEAQRLGILPENTNSIPQAVSSHPPPVKDLRNKLEGKPRQLIVINVDDKDALIKYFESFGGLTRFELDPDNSKNIIFTFKSRNIAEKAVKGSVFQGKPLIMKWYSPKPPPVAASIPSPAVTTTTTGRVSVSEDEKGNDNNGGEAGAVGKKSPPSSLELLEELNELEVELQDTPSIEVFTPEPSKPRVVHLLDDEEEDEERSWRR